MTIEELKALSWGTPISFRGRVFHSLEWFDGMALATKENFQRFEQSYAHIYPDGSIMRYHQKIGDVSEIHVVLDAEVLGNPELLK